MDVDEGDNLNLTCEANGQPVPSIAWTKSGTTLQTGSGTNTLQLTNIQRSGGGNYVCTAKNMAGSASFNVLVRIVRCEYCFILTLVFLAFIRFAIGLNIPLALWSSSDGNQESQIESSL